MDLPRLDLLLYAHDGRGLGHVSRTVAIGLALRRLYPGLKVLLATGCALTQELISTFPLDWVKLPSYRTEVIEGTSRGCDGYSGYSDHDLGRMRGALIRDLLLQHRPRLVLADHSPQGKHKELVPAIESVEDCLWVLGVRGVIGNVKQTESSIALELFKKHYAELLWYGDSSILGEGHMTMLKERFGVNPVECGYISRYVEAMHGHGKTPGSVTENYCTVAVPWTGEHTENFLAVLVEFIERNKIGFSRYKLFLGSEIDQSLYNRLAGLDYCDLMPFESKYLDILSKSKTAIIYGGYNSIVDVISANVPSLVVTRAMNDNEQQLHLKALCEMEHNFLLPVAERSCSLSELEAGVDKITESVSQGHLAIEVNGAEFAARYLAGLIDPTRDTRY